MGAISKMKILVTGHQGFIGSHLAVYFLEKGHEVEGWKYVPNTLPDVSMYDWVIHAGAISDTTETDIDKVWEHNFEFTSRLIQLCEQFGTNIQLASSSAVYGQGVDGFKETSKCLPQSPYAWSKFLIDKNLKDIGFDQFDTNIQSFRYFNVFGQNESHKGDQKSLVSKFINQASEDGKIKLFEDSKNYHRDLIYVEDVCKIHELMMDQNTNGIFNVGTGTVRNLEDLAMDIADFYDATIDRIPMPDKLKNQYQTYTCADLTLLEQQIDLPSFTSVNDYLDIINNTNKG